MPEPATQSDEFDFDQTSELAEGDPLAEAPVPDLEEADDRRERYIVLAEQYSQDPFGLAAVLNSPIVRIISIVSWCIVGMLVLGLVSVTAAALSMLPLVVAIIGGGLLAILSLGLLYGAVSLARLHWQVATHRRLPLAGLRQLAGRLRLRIQAEEQPEMARRNILMFLKSYPIRDNRRRLLAAGMTEKDLEALTEARKRLLDDVNHTPAAEWLERFHAKFQSVLDAAAQRATGAMARRVAFRSASSPYEALDMLMVLAANYALIGQLGTLYQVRLGRLATTTTVAHVFYQAYLSGQSDSYDDYITEASTAFGESAWNMFLSKFASKAASGAFNYRLVGKLGGRTSELFRPLANGK
jgi:hypothetical protein